LPSHPSPFLSILPFLSVLLPPLSPAYTCTGGTPLPSALCPLPSALCPLPSALYPMPYALCPPSAYPLPTLRLPCPPSTPSVHISLPFSLTCCSLPNYGGGQPTGTVFEDTMWVVATKTGKDIPSQGVIAALAISPGSRKFFFFPVIPPPQKKKTI
jgi:hypothetical protein